MANTPHVSGDGQGRVLVYFHQEQADERAINPVCRRQVQEETAGFTWTEKYAYDPEKITGPLLVPGGPETETSFEYQRPAWRAALDGGPAYHYSGTYQIGSAVFEGGLTSTLRVITFNGPPGSFLGPECTIPGPAPIVDGIVADSETKGDKLLCKYYDGVWERRGANPEIVLHGRCTITTGNGAVSAPVKETRRLIAAGDCQPVRPGTGFRGVGDCPYTMSAGVKYDP